MFWKASLGLKEPFAGFKMQQLLDISCFLKSICIRNTCSLKSLNNWYGLIKHLNKTSYRNCGRWIQFWYLYISFSILYNRLCITAFIFYLIIYPTFRAFSDDVPFTSKYGIIIIVLTFYSHGWRKSSKFFLSSRFYPTQNRFLVYGFSNCVPQ